MYGDNHGELVPIDHARKLVQEQTGRSLEEWSRLPTAQPAR